jgi:hypothetical protein
MARVIAMIPCAKLPPDPTPEQEVECYLLGIRDTPPQPGEIKKWLDELRNRSR